MPVLKRTGNDSSTGAGRTGWLRWDCDGTCLTDLRTRRTLRNRAIGWSARMPTSSAWTPRCGWKCAAPGPICGRQGSGSKWPQRRWPDVYAATGTVRARSAAVLSSKVMAYVREVAVQVGDRVREGQLLVTLESQDLDANVRRTEAAEAEVLSAIPEADQGMVGAK